MINLFVIMHSKCTITTIGYVVGSIERNPVLSNPKMLYKVLYALEQMFNELNSGSEPRQHGRRWLRPDDMSTGCNPW